MDIVLAIPHSTREIQTQWDNNSVEEDADIWTDWHTDTIFDSNLSHVSKVVGKVSRFDCDLERLENDPMESKGMGILYNTAPSGAKRIISKTLEIELLNIWESYRQEISTNLKENSLLIDCHSFPSDISDKDICIGFNEDESKPSNELIELITSHFTEQGYSVGINEPFSNSITPTTEFNYSSVMIELNKKIYFNEKTLQEYGYSYKVNSSLNFLYEKIKLL